MRTILARLRTLAGLERGQTMAEYSLILAVISVGVVIALTVLSSTISGVFDTVNSIV